MGSSVSKSVDFKVPVEEICPKQSDHHFHCGTKPRSPHRHPSSQKLKESWSRASRHNSEKHHHHHEGPNYHHRWQKKRATSPGDPGSITSNPSVLIVNEGESESNLSYTSELVKTKRYHLERSLRDFNKEFEDVHVDLENFPNKDEIRRENEKLYKFVTAWKTGLTGYPHERIEKVCSDIPLAATSHCRQGISRCQRCYRYCLQCTAAEASEHLLEDLVHKESLDRFLYETEFEQVTSSIVIRQNLKRKRLHDSVKHPGEEGEEEEEGEIEDMSISIRLNLPPPVHLVHPPPDPLIHLPPPEMLHRKFDKHHQKEADLLEHETLEKAHHEHHHDFHFDEVVDKILHPHILHHASKHATAVGDGGNKPNHWVGIMDKLKEHGLIHDHHHHEQNKDNQHPDHNDSPKQHENRADQHHAPLDPHDKKPQQHPHTKNDDHHNK